MNDRRCPHCGFVVFTRAAAVPPPEHCPRCAARGHDETLSASPARTGRPDGPETRAGTHRSPITQPASSEAQWSSKMACDTVRITCERTEKTVRVNVTGELDLVSTPQLRAHLGVQLADHTQTVVLDLAEVTFVDLTGLHALLDAAAHGGDRFCVIPCPVLIHLLDIAGLHDEMPTIDTDNHARDGTGQRSSVVTSRTIQAPDAQSLRNGRRPWQNLGPRDT